MKGTKRDMGLYMHGCKGKKNDPLSKWKESTNQS